MLDYQTFKSGTDIRGVASDEDGRAVNLTDPAVENIAAGFARWLMEKTGRTQGLRVSVGHDSRISAGRLKGAVTRGLIAAGIDVLDCGLSSTPAMFMTTVPEAEGGAGTDGAVQITASHHPFDRNGLKFFTPDGGLDGPDIARILDYAARRDEMGGVATLSGKGQVQPLAFMPRYAALLRRIIARGVGKTEESLPLSGFHIVVDAGNGAGGFYATQVLAPLGADISGSQFLEPDGYFPNHIPNPENETAMQSVCTATRLAGADLGVIFDTDVDRAGCVDRQGHEINRNRLVALAAAIALEDCPGGTIVTDSITSSGLKSFIEKELGGVHYRYRRGYRNVINKAMELEDQGMSAPLAIETSGHAALKENYFLDDGAYLITKIIIKLARLRAEGKDLEDLIGGLPEPVEAAEVRFAIKEADFKTYGEQVIAALEQFAAGVEGWQIADDNREGVRVSVEDGRGWFLLRLSVHDPIMPMNLESDRAGGVRDMAAALLPFFQQFDGLDTAPLDKLL
ncbi:MAG: phosphomannomutase/phosphoglucomutase [Clostridiales bacterium]|nr:phosphomannomutase/phosphoglucomutase [Clostridiales bacterium]